MALRNHRRSAAVPAVPGPAVVAPVAAVRANRRGAGRRANVVANAAALAAVVPAVAIAQVPLANEAAVVVAPVAGAAEPVAENAIVPPVLAPRVAQVVAMGEPQALAPIVAAVNRTPAAIAVGGAPTDALEGLFEGPRGQEFTAMFEERVMARVNREVARIQAEMLRHEAVMAATNRQLHRQEVEEMAMALALSQEHATIEPDTTTVEGERAAIPAMTQAAALVGQSHVAPMATSLVLAHDTGAVIQASGSAKNTSLDTESIRRITRSTHEAARVIARSPTMAHPLSLYLAARICVQDPTKPAKAAQLTEAATLFREAMGFTGTPINTATTQEQPDHVSSEADLIDGISAVAAVHGWPIAARTAHTHHVRTIVGLHRQNPGWGLSLAAMYDHLVREELSYVHVKDLATHPLLANTTPDPFWLQAADAAAKAATLNAGTNTRHKQAPTPQPNPPAQPQQQHPPPKHRDRLSPPLQIHQGG